MSNSRLISLWTRSNLKSFRRDPAAVFFTLALPLIFLFLFMAIFGNQKVGPPGQQVNYGTWYVPGIVALAVITTTFSNLAITLATAREYGVLKRIRGTPLPTWIYIIAQVSQATVLTLLITAVIVIAGKAFYGVHLPQGTLPAFLATLVVGTAAFCCLGIAMTAIIPTESAAPAVANAVILPLLFISGVFFPLHGAPGWLATLADIFPVAHFSDAVRITFDPFTAGSGFQAKDLLVMAGWGAGGLIVALRWFRWTPRND